MNPTHAGKEGVQAADPAPELERLLAESVESVRARERALADLFAGTGAPPLVLFGAGNLGRRTAAELRRLGVPCAGFSDSAQGLWGTEVDGLCVFPPTEAAARFGAEGVFVVTIWQNSGRHRFADTRRALQAMGCANVLPFASLFWSYPERLLPYMGADLPGRVAAAQSKVRAAADLWSDRPSQEEYLAQLRWRLLGDLGGLHDPVDHEQYFATDLFDMNEEDVFADCGAFDGDTVKALVERTRLPFRELHAFEPDPSSFGTLEHYTASLPPETRRRIVLHPVAVASHRGSARFTADGTTSAALSNDGEIVVACVPLDEVLAASPPTFIKMDIEGAEADALRGARTILRKQRPIVAISAYHRQADLWELPLLLGSLCEEYSYFLRPHQLEGFELVCYAVPRERLLPRRT